MTATVDRTSDAVNQLATALAAQVIAQVTAEVERLAPQLLDRITEQEPAPATSTPPARDGWMDVAEAATRSRRSRDTLYLALGEYVRTNGKRGLRGSQERPGCSWRIRPADLEAWMAGEQPKRRRP